jgi:hypothetical protein
MLPSRHAAYGAVASLLAAPWLRQRALALWAGSVVIDVDHYLWYAVNLHDLSLPNAYRYFRRVRDGETVRDGDARPLHGPINLGWMALLAWRWPAFRPVFYGIALHSLLDAYAEHRLNALLPLHLRAA